MGIPRLKMTKNEEILALTSGILHIGPLYRKYTYIAAQVCFDWAEDRKSVTVSYLHNDILCYQVKAEPYKEEELLVMRLTMLPVGQHTEDQVNTLKGKTIVTDFYNLLGVITRTVFQNNADQRDTQEVVVRPF